MLEMRLMLRTMLSELHPSVPRGSVWRRGEWTRRRAITLVSGRREQRVVWSDGRGVAAAPVRSACRGGE